MDSDLATNAVKEEHSPVEETDDSCIFKYFEIVPLFVDSDHTYARACVGGDWSAEVRQENLAVVKEEPNDVCCVLLQSVYIIGNRFSLDTHTPV